MQSWMMIIPILLPILFGALTIRIRFSSRRALRLYVGGVAVLNSLLTAALLYLHPAPDFTALKLAGNVSLSFHVDGLSMVFAGLLAFLWPLATCYAFAYMEHEGGSQRFLTWYTITYGVALGVALSANLVTMYLCYELLTIVTLPLVMHKMDRHAIHAGRKYLIYSITGAAFALMGIIILYHVTGDVTFIYGGQLAGFPGAPSEQLTLIRLGYLFAFFGFGVKSAIWPLHGWLPTAGVAPTPVTALLHAVAVVKAGVFAIMRLTWYSYGTNLLRGTWVQTVVMTFAVITIVFGSAAAVKEQHFKRRLAYSTVSNLSYIVFGVTLMTPGGLSAALAHMIFHGVMKICLFFGAGAVIVCAGKSYLWEIKGLGKQMPITFSCFIVSSLAVIGIPGFCGFISKWQLCTAAFQTGTPLSLAGIAALILSAILTSIYLFTIIVPACCTEEGFDPGECSRVKDPDPLMWVPMVLLSVMTVVLGLGSQGLLAFFARVGAGLI